MTPAQVADHIRKALAGLAQLQKTAPEHPEPLLNPRRHLAIAITGLEDVQARVAAARTYAAETFPRVDTVEPLVVPDTGPDQQADAVPILNPRLPR